MLQPDRSLLKFQTFKGQDQNCSSEKQLVEHGEWRRKGEVRPVRKCSDPPGKRWAE